MLLRDARHVEKFFYTLTESPFYEPFSDRYEPLDDYTRLVDEQMRELASGWLLSRDGVWFHVHPAQFDLPSQGWKVHVSATPHNAKTVLSRAARIALRNAVPFKFALDKNVLSLMGSKSWYRGASGKFMTFYPSDTDGFKSLIEQLYLELRSEHGPYILSDKRYRDCSVLYYRYGSIRQSTRLEFTGQKTSVLVSPDGEFVPDVRTPYFAPPAWAADPFASEPSESAADITLKSGRYRIKRALAFSNSGGVYLADDGDAGAEVVIKEARPHTAVKGSTDAIGRLQNERAILELLAGTGVAPKPLDWFFEWEHSFLVEEYLAGLDIRELVLLQSPFMLVRPSRDDSSRFYEVFRKTFSSFLNAVASAHAHGVVLGDLSAANLKIDPDTYTVRLIDFEGSFRAGIDEPPLLFTRGFKDPKREYAREHAFSDDHYAAAAIMLYTLFPIAALSSLRSDLYETVFRTFVNEAGWGHTSVYDVVDGLAKSTLTPARAIELLDRPVQIVAPQYSEDTDADACRAIARGLGEFLCSHMEPGRTSGLFPADPFMHQTNALSLGFGACGVLYTLRTCGFEIPQRAYDWLEKTLDDCDPDDLAPGLLTGSAGIAWCLWELGLRDRATALIARANGSRLLERHHSYLYGMAGVGMANLHFYLRTGQAQYLSTAEGLADALLETAKHDERGICWEADDVTHLGFGYGQSGVALFLLRLSQLSGRSALLAAGKRALDFDLSHGIENESGVLSFPRAPGDPTSDPYIEEGSAGIAKVAMRYGVWERMDAILSDCWRKYASFPGLLYGLGSFVDVFTDAYLLSGDRTYLEMAKRPICGLRDLYVLEQPRGCATPGDGLTRISCDYATGGAGILRALHRYTHLEESDFMLDEIGPAGATALEGRAAVAQR